MDFEIRIGDKYQHFTQFQDLIEALAYWNNFTPELTVEVRKVMSDTPTLGINTGDEIDTRDLFGRA